MRLHRRKNAGASLAVATIALLLSVPQSALAGDKTLLVLGDSYAYGFTTDQDAIAIGPTFGNQGYVKPFADYLGSVNGGVRPDLVNLAIPGESSTSFKTGVSAANYPDTYPYTSSLQEAPSRFPLLNLNYAPSAAPNYVTTPQKDVALGAIATAHASNKKVENIVLQIGGNDILGLLNQSAFLTLPPLQQQNLFTAQFAALQSNYVNILGTVRAAAPEARIFTVGYANSFRQTPNLGELTETLTLNANAIISGVSQNFGATYVDIYTPFKNHELELTYEAQGNPHPNATGYSVIAGQLQIAASAPEPATIALCILALPVAAFAVRRRITR